MLTLTQKANPSLACLMWKGCQKKFQVFYVDTTLPVWKFCHGASQAPTRKNRAPNLGIEAGPNRK